MRGATRILAAVAAVGIALLGAAPATAAPRQPVELSGFTAYEYTKDCTNVAPYSCGTYATNVLFWFRLPLIPNRPQTFGYVIEDITATHGIDYTGPTSGSVTIPTDRNFASVLLPVVNDGVAESDETLRLRITSSTFAGDVGRTAVATIKNDGILPPDCDLDRVDRTNVGLTCDDRPAGQSWRLRVTCGEGFTRITVHGTIVTGDGRSAANCPNWDYEGASFALVVT